MSHKVTSSGLPKAITPHGNDYAPIIQLLEGYLELFGPGLLAEAVASALENGLRAELETFGITSDETFLVYANDLLSWIPHETQNGKNIYDVLCAFYFVLEQELLSPRNVYTSYTTSHKASKWMSAWIVSYAQLIGLFMSTPDSITSNSFQTFVDCPLYRMGEAVIPSGGYKTFNEFFARKLKPGSRKIDDPDDLRTIVYPADSTFDGAFEVDNISLINVKGITWDIRELLSGSLFADSFENGIFLHCFLTTYNYQRQHAPVAGTVKEARVIQAAAYLDIEVAQDRSLHPVRGIGAGVRPDIQEDIGFQFLQSRGLIIIDSPEVGLVAVLPIGMAMISSVKLCVRSGEKVTKGQEISYFQFGGSECAVVFQQNSGLTLEDFPSKTAKAWSPMGSKLNTPNPAPPPPVPT